MLVQGDNKTQALYLKIPFSIIPKCFSNSSITFRNDRAAPDSRLVRSALKVFNMQKVNHEAFRLKSQNTEKTGTRTGNLILYQRKFHVDTNK